MVCVYCSGLTRVTNSRHQKKSNQVWRRRQCLACRAVFSTVEVIDGGRSISVKHLTAYQPFSRDKLMISVYDSLRHRKTAFSDATALTATILSQLYDRLDQTSLTPTDLIEVTSATLERFDKVAAVHYRAFHKLD